jgi:hypothetical protein
LPCRYCIQDGFNIFSFITGNCFPVNFNCHRLTILRYFHRLDDVILSTAFLSRKEAFRRINENRMFR